MLRFKSSILFATFALLPAISRAQAFPLVKDGKSQATIVIAPEASAAERFAAEELQSYLRRITGAVLPLAQSAGPGANVFVEAQSPRHKIKSFGEQESPDAFLVQSRGNTLRLTGHSDRSVLYAVYEFLEGQGVRFFAPLFDFYRGHGEFIPARESIEVGALDIRQQPSFPYRRKYVEDGWSHTARNLPQLIDWMAKSRLNVLVYPYDYQNAGRTRYDSWRTQLLPEIQKRGLIIEVGGHGYQSFLQPEKYRADHPDWFIEKYNVFNVASEEALSTYIANVIAYLKTRPEIKIFDAWAPDSARWAPEIIHKYGSIANAQAHVSRRLSEAVQRELPGVSIEAIAYTPAIAPPDAAFQYDDKTFIDFALYDRSYRDLIFGSDLEKNKTYNDLIGKWKASGFRGNFGIYEYYRKYAWHSLPVVLPKLIGQEIPYYQSKGAVALGIFSEPADWITYEVTHSLVAALTWDSSLNTEVWLKNYLIDRYGALSPALARYFEDVEQGSRFLLRNKVAGDFTDAEAVGKARDLYLDAQAALNEAQGKATTGKAAAFLIQRLSWNIDYVLADLEIARIAQTGDKEKLVTARRRFQEILEKYRFDGILLQNVFSVRRYSPDGNPEEREKRRAVYYDLYQQEWR